jgi:hypothetical protein
LAGGIMMLILPQALSSVPSRVAVSRASAVRKRNISGYVKV